MNNTHKQTQELCSHAYSACRRVRSATEYLHGKGIKIDITFKSVDYAIGIRRWRWLSPDFRASDAALAD